MRRIIAAVTAVVGLCAGMALVADVANAGDTAPPSYNDYFDSYAYTVNGDFEPILFGCAGESGQAWLLWYAAGPAADYLWTFHGNDPATFSSMPAPINGVYQPLAGDFDGDGCDDILWYAPSSGADYVWWGSPSGDFTSRPVTINGTYEPVVGSFGGITDDIFWYAPGTADEYVWRGNGDRSFTAKKAPSVNGDYRLASVEGSILFHRPGAGTDYVWVGFSDTSATAGQVVPTRINGSYEPLASPEGFLLYAAGLTGDYLLYDVEPDGSPETYPATINGTYETGVRSPFASTVHLWHAPGSGTDHLWVPAMVEATGAGEFDGRDETAVARTFLGG